jgi:hypothetical protein
VDAVELGGEVGKPRAEHLPLVPHGVGSGRAFLADASGDVHFNKAEFSFEAASLGRGQPPRSDLWVSESEVGEEGRIVKEPEACQGWPSI